MKKVSKLTALLAAGLLALGTFSFVSCSNGSGESSDTNNTPVTKEVTTTTTTITIGGKNYTYTTVDGTSQNSDGVTISDDGTITITADDGSKLTIKGTSITYTTSDGKTYSGTSSDSSDSESITLTGDSGEITATSKSETKTETVSSGSSSEISVSGNTYVAYTLSDSKAQIHSISFSSDSVELVKLTSKDSKDNEFAPWTCSYTVSGSDLLVDGEKFAVINSNGTITDTEGCSYTKYSGDVYAKTDYNSSKSKTVVEIVNLGSDGKGSFVEKIHKNGTDSDGDSFDFTYTKSGSSVTITVSSLSASGTISTGTQTGVSVEKLSVTWEEDDVGEYIKLN